MSDYYNPKRTRNLYNPKSDKPYKLSRSKLELFIECPRCFYLDRRLGIGRPPGYPFNLNSAVDVLLKNEFDFYRAKKEKHPLIKSYNIDAIPAFHEKLEQWQENFKGIEFLHSPTNLMITGAIDDLWQNSNQEFIVVDYKSTSKNEKITTLDELWQKGYKRQMEIYQWLLRQNGLNVSDTGYFVYCNGKKDKPAFNAKLEFEITLIHYIGNDNWVEKVINEAYQQLNQDKPPEKKENCDYCAYFDAIMENCNKHLNY
jgi:CRISPR/Cas system-associated exonuclease Cas4 (RecB family)